MNATTHPSIKRELRPFRELFCEFHRCPDRAYAKKVFWYSLHRWSNLLSAFVYAVNPAFFARDFSLIYNAGRARSYDEFYREIVDYQRQLRCVEWTWKSKWRLRVSGNRLAKLGSKLFHEESRKGGSIVSTPGAHRSAALIPLQRAILS